MKALSLRLLTVYAAAAFAIVTAAGPLPRAWAGESSMPAVSAVSKDAGPASVGCDRFEKQTAAWTGCVGQARAEMPSNEAFYAGYWLAKSGRYEEALRYLTLASDQDARVLTYIGFATRKLGDVEAALPYYRRAIGLNPNYAVARAYLGDAYLSKGEPANAKGELAEIERRCGASCAEYAELATHIADFEARGQSAVR